MPNQKSDIPTSKYANEIWRTSPDELSLPGMKSQIKKLLRQVLIRLGIPLTKNIAYDIATEKILNQVLKPDSCCVDIGAHKGEILDVFIANSPAGKHTGFEPIPNLCLSLKEKYQGKADIFPFALSDEIGTTTFNLVLDDPAYSGLKQRRYKTENPRIETIPVEVRTLDGVMAARDFKVALMKIDVEGGELGVMRGAQEILTKDKPILIFECGKGASEFYGTQPEDVYGFLTHHSYFIFTLDGFLKGDRPLSMNDFVSCFHDGKEYYFVATA
jgi:FkbM family methyltransferase